MNLFKYLKNQRINKGNKRCSINIELKILRNILHTIQKDNHLYKKIYKDNYHKKQQMNIGQHFTIFLNQLKIKTSIDRKH